MKLLIKGENKNKICYRKEDHLGNLWEGPDVAYNGIIEVVPAERMIFPLVGGVATGLLMCAGGIALYKWYTRRQSDDLRKDNQSVAEQDDDAVVKQDAVVAKPSLVSAIISEITRDISRYNDLVIDTMRHHEMNPHRWFRWGIAGGAILGGLGTALATNTSRHCYKCVLSKTINNAATGCVWGSLVGGLYALGGPASILMTAYIIVPFVGVAAVCFPINLFVLKYK